MARMTMSTRNTQGVVANLRQYGQAARVRVQAVVVESLERTFTVAQSLCPRDTGFMADAMRAELTRKGFGYQVGFEERDFTAAGKPFYPIFTEFGTTKMAAQPCIFPANEAEHPRFRRRLAEALKPSRGAAPTQKRSR